MSQQQPKRPKIYEWGCARHPTHGCEGKTKKGWSGEIWQCLQPECKMWWHKECLGERKYLAPLADGSTESGEDWWCPSCNYAFQKGVVHNAEPAAAPAPATTTAVANPAREAAAERWPAGLNYVKCTYKNKDGSVCGKLCVDKGKLKVHMRSILPQSYYCKIELPLGKYRGKCCGAAFKHAKDLKIHRDSEICANFMQDKAEVIAKEAAALSAVAAALREVD